MEVPAVKVEINPHPHERRAEHVMTILLAILFGGCAVAYWLSREQCTYFATLIFVLPLIQIGLSSVRLGAAWERYRWVLAGGFLHVAFWGFYIASIWFPWLQAWFSTLYILCLIAFLLAVIFVFALTSDLIKNRAENELVADLERHPLLTISSFLVLFLFVTFFLTFALAFHDGSKTGPGLFVKQLIAKKKAPANGGKITRTLWFDEGMADLQIDSDLDSLQLTNCKIFSDDRARLRKCLNCMALREITESLNSYKSHERIRVTIMGHANDKALKGKSPNSRYQSNFELATARVYDVQYLVNKSLSEHPGSQRGDHNIEWLLSPVSNEETFLDPSTQGNSLLFDPKLSVEIGLTAVYGHLTELQMLDLVRPTQSLELLDYLYFMVYTVTTTGYGDIIPITPLAKFITILANFFELFFAVVFLNVLIACARAR